MATSSKQRVLRSGVVIAEKYRVDKAIARGGFSVIYRGTHIEMQRPVALKLLTIDDEIKGSWLERFTREARLASQLTHPNTVTIFDYGQDERGFLYIVMEWVDGVSLYQHLKSHGALSPPDVASITAQILLSLEEAHRRGFLHRDLKPSNIMLSHDYEGQDMVKVLDFGIAKHLDDARGTSKAVRITHQGAFIGTPRYASPEQLDGKALTPAADIYSLGLLMWEALVGDPAVPSIEYGDCVKAHLGSEPWRLPDSVQCPPGLAVILYKALEKSIDQRYQSCREMHRELAAWLESSEALRESEQEFFTGGSASAAFEPSGLGADSSSVDEDELFAGLTEESDSQDEPPLDLHGPSTADDPFERELMALADGSATEPRSSAEQSETPKQPEKKAKPPAPRRPPSPRPASMMPAQPNSSVSQKKKTIVISAVAALLILGAGAYAFLSGGESDPDAPTGGEVAASEQVGADQAESDRAASAQEGSEQQDEASLDDGTPTYGAGFIWRAISESEWRRIGQVDTLDFSDVIQSSARFRKQAMTVTVTVYETDSHLGAEQYVETAKEPMQAIRFGKTAVQVSPGAKGNSTRGVYDLMSSLFQLKAIARQQVEEKGEEE